MSDETQKRSIVPAAVFFGLVLLATALFTANVALGSVWISFKNVWGALLGADSVDTVVRQIVVDFRLPRALTAGLAGGGLAVAGLLMQTVFRNPLADPFVLGVNSGASLGVAIALLVLAPAGVTLAQGLELSGNVLIVVSATCGAAIVLSIVLVFAQRVDVMSLLILGLMLSYAVGAVVSILMFYSMAERLQSFFSWSYGSFENVSWSQLRVFGPVMASGVFLSFLLGKPLDALLMGERYAESLGVSVRRNRILSLGVASALAGCVTGFCGPIGFIGIAAPHLCRYLFKTGRHRMLLPASAVMGAAIALAADLVAKRPGVDGSLPLNAVTALVGAPIIMAALLKQRHLRKVFG